MNIFGLRIDALTSAELLSRVEGACRSDGRLRIEGVNVAKLIAARSDPLLAEALDEAEIVHLDGRGVYFGCRLARIPIAPNIPGIDLMQDMIQLAATRGFGVYLLGARRDVVEATAEALSATYPGLVVAGMRDGYFGDEDETEVVAEIARSGARMLFIGISSPKKELFLRRHWQALQVSVAMGVGGSFDVVSGVLPRAPRWMQRAGLEWAFRLLQEPKRLARRYAVTNVQFAVLVAQHILGIRRGSASPTLHQTGSAQKLAAPEAGAGATGREGEA